MRTVRGVFATVAVIAGTFGVIMLISPDDTDTYFSWPIGPPALAATVGGCYVASAIVFALGAASDEWFRVRSLCVGGLALTIPTFVATIYDRDVFDFGRLLAIVWVVLFLVSPIVFSAILVAHRDEVAPPAAALPPWVRAAFGVAAVGFTALAVAAWLDPVAVGDRGPYAMAALGGRFLGSWAAFLATLAGSAASRNRRTEAFLPAVALTMVPLMALVAALGNWDELTAGPRRTGYVVALVVLAAIGGALTSATAPSRHGAADRG